MAALLWIAVAAPLVGALVTRACGRRAAPVAAAAALAAALPAWVLLAGAAGGARERSGFAWLSGAGLDAGLRLDGLSAAMAATVATVGLVVVVYAGGYFAAEPRRPQALAGLLAFLAAMQGLVLADGYLALLVFWEIVGALSARLIAFNRDDAAAPPAAVRAFLTTRAADAGLYVALLALYAGAGTLAFGADRPEGALGVLVGLGLVVAAIGKSAQAPLHTWLGDAMAGPTPVSALLHSATMVAAGVYLLIRSDALLAGWPLEVAGWVGALTAVAGAAIALAQTDLKRVLAGSTTSQLGLMFVGAAAGGPAVALFHLVAHAAGKATMFLAAGIFGHQRGGTDLEDLRGAGRADPRTFAAFAVGALSIAAVPPLAAFWSKDAIVAATEGRLPWLVLVVLAAAGSAAYLLRPALILWGRPPEASAAAATPAAIQGRGVMLAAAGALAAASVGIGVLGHPLAELLGQSAPSPTLVSVLLSLAAVALGAGAVLRGVRAGPSSVAAARRGLYAREGIRTLAERPVLAAAGAAARLDEGVIDRAVDDAGRATIVLARAQGVVERHGIDAAVDGLARLVGRGGAQNRHVQTGRLHEYLRDSVLGAGAVVVLIALAAVL